MNNKVFVSLLLIFIFLVSFLLLNEGIVLKITGKQVFSDTDFELPAESFRPSNPTRKPILLSPPDCRIVSYFPLNLTVSREDSFSAKVYGH